MTAPSPDSSPELRGADSELERVRARLRRHRLYQSVRTATALRAFTEHHVVCVLDFMSLLKSLQRDLTCVDVPWTPSADPESARLVAAIALDEETDVRADGRVQSHFAWYLEAMEELGADTAPARELVERLRASAATGAGTNGTSGGARFEEALCDSRLPSAAREFGLVTAGALDLPLHARAAVFFHGREELIPALFLPILDRLAREGLACDALRGYLERHVEVDGGDHGPRARRMLERLYAGDAGKRAEAERAALDALEARAHLWDAIADATASDEVSASQPAGCAQGS